MPCELKAASWVKNEYLLTVSNLQSIMVYLVIILNLPLSPPKSA